MTDSAGDEALFLQLVAMFQYAAMQQMGKIANPVNGKIERNLDQARMSIDMIRMLQRRTAGSRSKAEDDFFDKVLFELQMNYVDEARRGDSEAPGETDGNDEPSEGT